MPNTSSSEDRERDKKPDAIKHLQICWMKLDRLQRTLRQREKLARKVGFQRLSIPHGPELDRIQRYETGISRDMYRAMDQLECLQRRRRGEPPPPTLKVNVSNSNSD